MKPKRPTHCPSCKGGTFGNKLNVVFDGMCWNCDCGYWWSRERKKK